MSVYSTSKFHDNQAMLRDEWLMTNGLGGFAGSTVSGANTRKYHGLLIAAFNPPVDRRLMVSKLDERIITPQEDFNLATNLVNDLDLEQRAKNLTEISEAAFDDEREAEVEMDVKYTNRGHQYLNSFTNQPYPTYTYLAGGVMLEKSIFMVQGENTTVVKYRILDAKKGAELELQPLLNCRNHNKEKLLSDLDYELVSQQDNKVKLVTEGQELNIAWTAGSLTKKENYFTGMHYPFENYRGESDMDDHYIPGTIRVDASETKEFAVVFSTTELAEIKAEQWAEEYKARQQKLIEKYPGENNPLVDQLVLAADDFVTYRKSTDNKTIMAGYPWFTDWGRDTMIALPGITLATGREDDAKEILTTFALNLKDGLLPNVFDDISGEACHYNTVDATLWFFYALKKYYDQTGDKEFIKEIYPKLEDVIKEHKQGTSYNIQMDPTDGLLTAGEDGVQLTWMDAKVEDWVVTPRQGKAVEINALWYNSLRIFNELGTELGYSEQNLDIIAKIEENFADKFWYQEGNYLYDVISDQDKDDSLRPNQVFVVSLPYSLLDDEREKAVIDAAYEELYTPLGMRSLAPSDERYHGNYEGKRAIRDAAYHQGTTWGWLIGSFFEGYLKVNNCSDEAKEKVLKMYQPFAEHLENYGLGTISEVFDGDFPHEPRGCYAQAWSIAELLRVYTDYLAD
ncbi:MAG: amylo-alpha-1,6-glucosidase [Bacillota bacterium]